VNDPANQRKRVIVWDDPNALLQGASTMTGLEAMQAIQAGKLPHPPIAALMDIRMTDVSEGRVVCEMDPGEYQCNPLGTVHGGALTTLMDSSMSCAVHSMLPAGTGYATLDVTANFVRPVRSGTGSLRCEGTVLHFGSRTATAQCQVTDPAGVLCAHGTVTCMILRPDRR
jgi:uncharacterized protein (TIGR00369 family)